MCRLRFALLALLLTGCPPPGSGLTARRGYRAADVAMRALGAYYADQHRYPDSLQELLPRYLAQQPTLPGPLFPIGRRYLLEYKRTERDYQIGFSYGGSGRNHCYFSPSAGPRWTCHGYY